MNKIFQDAFMGAIKVMGLSTFKSLPLFGSSQRKEEIKKAA
jgi:hypothetical protein